MYAALPIDTILAMSSPLPMQNAVVLGASREGQQLYGFRFGDGPRKVSLIAGCHADEPVGPAMLDRLVTFLATQPEASPLLRDFTWTLVPHANPDGEARNDSWTTGTFDRWGPFGNSTVDLDRYLRLVIREAPGDDMEFGFPRDKDDTGARPENQAIAQFLTAGGPYGLHGSFHGMAFAAGPWFLIEEAWINRTAALRERLRDTVRKLNYPLHDIDRKGDKGFHRIDEGFTTRPDSRAMTTYFLDRGDSAMAALFRPSSMEFVRSLGGDPFTLVSEMPLFLAPEQLYQQGSVSHPAALSELRAFALLPDSNTVELEEQAAALGIHPMLISDQMRLQLELLNASLDTAF